MRTEDTRGWWRRRILEGSIFGVLAAMSASTGILLKEGVAPRAMMAVDSSTTPRILATSAPAVEVAPGLAPEAMTVHADETDPLSGVVLPTGVTPDQVRWFNARPVVPVKKVWMKVTAYSPDARSCGEFADGKTATLHSVETNAGRLVAADTRILPYGSMLTVPGYDAGQIVPVLDCGGAIKGHRLDVLFPTHEQAREWGVRHVQVTVWGYADGKPSDDPRKLR